MMGWEDGFVVKNICVSADQNSVLFSQVSCLQSTAALDPEDLIPSSGLWSNCFHVHIHVKNVKYKKSKATITSNVLYII